MNKFLYSLAVMASSFGLSPLAYSAGVKVIAISKDQKTVRIGSGPDLKTARLDARYQCEYDSSQSCWYSVETTGPHQCISVAVRDDKNWVGQARWVDTDPFIARHAAIGLAIQFCAGDGNFDLESCASSATVCNH